MKIDPEMGDIAIAKEISSRFKQYRIEYPMTREELADRSMVSAGTIARFENGSDIGLVNFIKLLKALGLDEKLDLLIPDPEERPSYYAEKKPLKKRARKPTKTETSWKWGDEK